MFATRLCHTSTDGLSLMPNILHFQNCTTGFTAQQRRHPSVLEKPLQKQQSRNRREALICPSWSSSFEDMSKRSRKRLSPNDLSYCTKSININIFCLTAASCEDLFPERACHLILLGFLQ